MRLPVRCNRIVEQTTPKSRFGLSEDFEVRVSLVPSEKFSALRWGPFEKTASASDDVKIFPLGDRLIQLENTKYEFIELARSLIWISQFQKLGIDGIAQALTLVPGSLEKFIETELDRTCGHGNC